jgi:hypothetical protein
MPSTRNRNARPAMYNTPAIRNGGFGALQVEAVTNRPLSIARRHLAASQLRMRDVEPDQLSQSEWVRFLVMPEVERERWISQFRRRRDSAESAGSSSGPELDPETAYLKSEEARLEAGASQNRDTRRIEQLAPSSSRSVAQPTGAMPAASMFAWYFDEENENENLVESGRTSPRFSARRPVQHRRAVTATALPDAPPSYDAAVRPRARTPPPAYEPRSDDDDCGRSPRYTRFADS